MLPSVSAAASAPDRTPIVTFQGSGRGLCSPEDRYCLPSDKCSGEAAKRRRGDILTRVRVLDVLIVDDDDADAMMIDEALHAAATAATVHRVADGVQALEYLRREGTHTGAPRPDLILLDLNMPRMGGREVLAAIKNDEELRAIPVVVLTTSNAVPDVVGSYTQHANAYVTKPMDLDSFEAAVQQISRFYSDIAVLPGTTPEAGTAPSLDRSHQIGPEGPTDDV